MLITHLEWLVALTCPVRRLTLHSSKLNDSLFLGRQTSPLGSACHDFLRLQWGWPLVG